jgi:hypothetical protein
MIRQLYANPQVWQLRDVGRNALTFAKFIFSDEQLLILKINRGNWTRRQALFS